MDKNAIKKFSVWARRELIERVSQKAMQYGMTQDNMIDESADSINGVLLSDTEKKQRQKLISKINDEGFEKVIEDIAYTWFNRFIALRFMEVNGYLPTHIRVFTNEENRFKPQIMDEAIHLELDGLDMEQVYKLKNANKNEELYKYLLITQCNALSGILPKMFQRISDYTELLFPDNLLREGSVIEQMISMIPEEDWRDAVQIIGWLYQYYNTEKKDEVFAALKKNVKITKENIPAATQLFTPDWIVRYMVENSLGRLWIEGHPNDELKASWKYYLEEAEQQQEVQAQLAEIRKEYASINPEQIKCIDPCCGSGHILVSLFDVLVQIYESYGYTTREAVESIVKNNLYGLEIDDRAAQLAYFAVMMKARQYDRRFFSRQIQPNVYEIQESNHIDRHALDYFCNENAKLKAAMNSIIEELHDAKEYGSILNITPVDFSALYARFEEVKEDIDLSKEIVLNELLPLVQVAEALAQKYDVICTNPPYMGSSGMNPRLSDFIKKYYADYKSDFFSAFIVHCSQMATPNGKLGFFTPYVWMFIQSYEKLRKYLYNRTIENLIQFEYSAFEEATVPVCTFVFQNRHVQKKGCYLRLVDFRGGMEVQRQKTLEAIVNHDCGFYYEQNTDNFSKIPGSPVAYWVSDAFFHAFDNKKIGDYAISDGQTKTGNNDKYLRLIWEVEQNRIGKKNKWVIHAKGGSFRRWYGNIDTVIDWSDTARRHYRVDHVARIAPEYIWFRKGICWTLISSSKLHGYRLLDDNSTFNLAAPSIFFDDEKMMYYILGFLNTKLSSEIVSLLNPTLNTNISDITSQPLRLVSAKVEDIVLSIVHKCIILSRLDWDSFETSWDFNKHPLIRSVSTVSDAFTQWEKECNHRFNQLKANEEELNRIFIDIYGLQDELSPEVEDKDVTVRKADLQRDIKSLISYAVGCMFGRYSLDVEGLAYAGGEWDSNKYSTYPADKDNIIPICNDEYFNDDILGLFIKFIEIVYSSDTLGENLKFIADALGGKGQPKEVIRNYFLNDFYADHCKIYQKRPIYWLFDSGKKNGFKALIYMHRYQPDTIARIRTDYVHEQQSRYHTAIEDIEKRIAVASTSERVKLNKTLTKLKVQDAELRTYEEKIHHLADQMISIDLDDGVKVNYAKFRDVLAKIK